MKTKVKINKYFGKCLTIEQTKAGHIKISPSNQHITVLVINTKVFV